VNSSITINPWDKTITISKTNIRHPVTLHHPKLVGSLNATINDIDSITFSSMSEVVKINVTSANQKTIEWSILLEDNSQLPNAALDLWVDQTFGTKTAKNIDPIPGKGKGWATANNNYVQGTLPVANQGVYAAQMTTAIQNVPLLDHDLIAAGSMYTGFFQLNLDFEHPRIMTNFGIPHKLRIESVRFDAKYISGTQLMQAVKQNEGDKYRLVDLEGYDNGQAWVELLHWDGKAEDIKYHGEPTDGLTVLGRGEHIFAGNDDQWHEWSKVTLPIIYNEEHASLSPTHIAVVFSSSKEGEFFKGAPGSTLIVDNLELIY
jgi:hypothetical protein